MADVEYRGYLYAASKDVLAIEALSGVDTELHSEAIAFHSQQAAEKMIKAVYTTNGAIPPKLHDIGKLLSKAIENGWLTCDKSSVEAAVHLSAYAVAARYESAREIGKGEAIQAMADCNAIAKMLKANGYEVILIKTDAHYLHDEEA